MNLQLNAREIRKQQIEAFFREYPSSSLIVIKANMPSFLINKPINYYLIQIFLDILKQHFEITKIIYYKSEDGPYFFIQLNGQDINIKQYLINIEEVHPLGRLIDLDYFIDGYKSVSRTQFNYPRRNCFICNKDATICMREISIVKNKSKTLLIKHLFPILKNKLLTLLFTHY